MLLTCNLTLCGKQQNSTRQSKDGKREKIPKTIELGFNKRRLRFAFSQTKKEKRFAKAASTESVQMTARVTSHTYRVT
jgi:hypothetical protein